MSSDSPPELGTIALDPADAERSDDDVTIDRPSVVGTLLEEVPRAQVGGGRYRVQHEIARGGMGRVLLAEDKDINRPVAVKVMRAGRTSPVAKRRFVEEVQLAGQLAHPNIVPVFDVGVTADGAGWYAMRYVEGSTLADVIARLRAGDPLAHALFTPARRLKLFLDVLDAVAYAHARRIIHRDLKPANILVGTYGEVFVSDWGIAERRTEDALKRREVTSSPDGAPVSEKKSSSDSGGSVLGTAHYMAPEQARGELELVDERSDVYALCAILFELLSLEHYLWPMPRDAPREEILQAVREKVPVLATSVQTPAQPLRASMDFSRLIARGLAKDPSLRFQSVNELRDAIQRIYEFRPRVQCPSTLALWSLGGLRRLMSRFPVLGWFIVAAFFGLAAFGAASLVELALHTLLRSG